MVPSKTYRKDPSAFSTRTSPFDVDGNEMLALLDKALYRHPIASLRRSQTRDAFTLMKFFDERGWGCICIIDYDPCMFVMLSATGGRVVFVTRTDDFRVARDDEGDVDYVVDNFHAEFKITPVTTGSCWVLKYPRVSMQTASGMWS